jgi:dipeptide/tripeptide permease
MIKCAVEDYKLTKDDMLIDSLSSLFNIAFNIGEIIGPVFAGFATSWIGYNSACTVVGLVCFFYAIIYGFGSGLVTDKRKPYKIIQNSFEIKLYDDDLIIPIS